MDSQLWTNGKKLFKYSKWRIATICCCFYRPKVHAQRKFAQGQGILPSPLKKPSNGQQSSGSSTASGPTTKKLKMPENVQKGECPKTEDFLTFLCLRGKLSKYLVKVIGFTAKIDQYLRI